MTKIILYMDNNKGEKVEETRCVCWDVASRTDLPRSQNDRGRMREESIARMRIKNEVHLETRVLSRSMISRANQYSIIGPKKYL